MSPKRPPKTSNAVPLWILTTVCLVVGAVLLYRGIHNIRFAKESLQWPVAQAIVRRCQMEYLHKGYGKRGSVGEYHVDMLYEFHVLGRPYTGTEIAFAKRNSGSMIYARSMEMKYPKGTRVRVSYMLTNPRISLLEPGPRAILYLLPGSGLLLLLIGIALPVIWVIHKKRRENRLLSAKRKKQP